jgi:cytochrome b561
LNLFSEIHGISVLANYWLIGLHLLGAIYHRLKKNGGWNSMIPFLKEKNNILVSNLILNG